MSFIDLTGQRFGSLVVVRRAQTAKGRPPYWLCLCDCGNEHIVKGDHLRSGNVKSCGCLVVQQNRSRSVTHDGSKTRLYRIWLGIRRRCYDVGNPAYHYYGGRGVGVCEEWKSDFVVFRDWALANGYDEKLSLDRIDSDGDYSPENCRWTTMKVQQNNKRSNIRLEYNGEIHTLAEWAERYGLRRKTLYARIKNGWSVERALTKDIQIHDRNRNKTEEGTA